MKKKEILNDVRFRYECSRYGIRFKKMQIYNDIIILHTKNEDVKIFMDKDYDVIKVYRITPQNMDIPIEEAADFYNTAFNSKMFFISGSDNIKEISYKQMVDIYNLITANKELYSLFDNEYINKYNGINNIRVVLFICILGKEVKRYFRRDLEMAMFNLEYIDLNLYMRKLTSNIHGYINNYLDNDIMIFPSEVLRGLKNNYTKEDNKELFNVISAIIEGEAYEIEDINDDIIRRIINGEDTSIEEADEETRILKVKN